MFSSWGHAYAFLIVGPNPSRSTKVSSSTAQNGLEVKYQNGNEDKAAMKNSQSVRVIEIWEDFRKASSAM